MILLAVFCLVPTREAQAATAKKLFTITINDGFVSQQVPVYQYTETNGSFYVAAKKTLRTLPVYAGAKTAAISISGKTSLYTSTYKSVTYKKKVTLSSTTSLNLTLKTKGGAKKTMTVKLTRPSMPSISSLSVSPSSGTGFTPGNYSRLSVKLNMKSTVAVRAYYKIKDSKGKVVYQKDLGTRKSTNYTAYWEGKPSQGNQSGLSTSDYVPAGTYKLTAYLQYTVGGKNKYISKTVTVKVKAASSGENGNADNSGTDNGNSNTGSSDSSAFQAANWNWKITLSGDDTLDYMVETICQEVLTNNMSEIQRAKALYSWCDKNLTHIYTNIDVSASQAKVDQVAASAACVSYAKQADTQIAAGKAVVNWTDGYFGSSEKSSLKTIKRNWIKAGLIQKRGNCLVMASIYQTLLRHAGIEAHIVENDSSAGHHFWNVVKIGSGYYYTDVDRTTYDSVLSDSDYTYFLRGTDFFYKEKLYSTVAVNKKNSSGEYRYAIAKQVSAADCPGR